MRYVIEGSVRRVGNSLRANAQLISAETGAHLWADRFDVDAGGSATGQDEIIQRLGTALDIEIVQSEATRSARERSTNPDALDFILRARALHDQPRNVERDAAAQALYEQALQLDPSSTWTMANLAMTLIRQRLNRGYWRDGSEQERVERLVAGAQTIAPAAEVSLAAAAQLHEVEGRYQEAMATAQRLIEINPNNHNGYVLLARNKIYTGQAEQAVSLLTKAMQLNPRDPSKFDRLWRMGYALLMVERYQESIVWQQRAMAAFPDAPGNIRSSRYRMMAVAYALSGQIDDARRARAEGSRIWPFETIRGFSPEDLTSEARVAQVKRFQDGLRAANLATTHTSTLILACRQLANCARTSLDTRRPPPQGRQRSGQPISCGCWRITIRSSWIARDNAGVGPSRAQLRCRMQGSEAAFLTALRIACV